ncbi:MAG: AMP-binding protein [Methylotetracoccus sp.]
MTTLGSLLVELIRNHPDRPALRARPRYRTERWTYAELGARTSRLERLLAEAGIEPGERVLLQAENSPHWVAAFFAVLARGAVVVPLNPGSPAAQIERIAATAEPRLILRSSRLVGRIGALPTLTIDVPADGPDEPLRVSEQTPPDAIAEIIFTSGTTGDPKGVMLSHGNLLANLASIGAAVPIKPDDHVLNLLPLFHVFGQMTGILGPLAGGCAISYVGAPTSRAIVDALRTTPVTHLIAIPEVLNAMMDRIEARLGRMPGWMRAALRARIRARVSPTLRTIVCGGAPLDAELEEKWWALGIEVLQGYGLTETSPVVAANTPEAHRIGTVGRPLPGVDVRIADDGEILVRGANVMQGYFRNPEATAEVVRDGWFHTGDGGELDPDGYLRVFGRRKYMILGPSGENVFPEDIEAELNREDGIVDSAVVGLTVNGRTVIHAVLLGNPGGADAAVAAANRRLAPHQQIMNWSIWPEPDFPRSVTRKVRKNEVIKHLASQASAPIIAVDRITPVMRLLADVTAHPPAELSPGLRLGADLGLDSLLRIELVARIEQSFGVYLEELQITPATTVADLEGLVAQRARSAPPPTHYPRWSLSGWAQALRPIARAVFLRSWILRCCRLRVSGTEHLAGLRSPSIFMANHRSFLDSAVACFAMPAAIQQRLGIAASTEVLYRRYRWAVPLGELAMNAFPFPTGVDENIRPGLELLGRLLDDEWNVLIFPEGRMNRDGTGLQALKAGTGVIAVEMGVPVVPMIVDGTERIMPPDTLLPRARGEVRVRFGAPLMAIPGERYEQAAARIDAALHRLLAET